MDQLGWLRMSVMLPLCSLLLAAWQWLPIASMDLQHLSAWLEPHRRAWYALPMFMLVFVVLAMVPVLLLTADIVVGASSVAYRHFLLGTILGRGALVIALAGFALVLNGLLRRARPAA